MAMHELLQELQPEEDGQLEIAETELFDDGRVLDEHEAKEVLSTMIAQKNKTSMQSLRTKKAKSLAKGFGQWKDKGGSSPTIVVAADFLPVAMSRVATTGCPCRRPRRSPGAPN